MMKYLIFSLSIAFSGSFVFGQSSVITTAVPFVHSVPDARGAGMANAVLASDANAFSPLWNMASTAFSDQKLEIGVSYRPWLRTVVDGGRLLGASGYYKLNDRHTIGATYRTLMFNLNSSLPYDDVSAFEADFGLSYAFKLSEKSAIGVHVHTLSSRITYVNNRCHGRVPAVDINYFRKGNHIGVLGIPAWGTFAVAINNIGPKFSYNDIPYKSFIPTNLKIGTGLKVVPRSGDLLSFLVNVEKLLVPSAPVVSFEDGILSGKDNNVSAAMGMLQSFYDAPGNVIIEDDGTVIVESGSRLKEELHEISIGLATEYKFQGIAAARLGYYYQHINKGGPHFISMGLGASFKQFNLDLAYWAALRQNFLNANTLHFTLSYRLGQVSKA